MTLGVGGDSGVGRGLGPCERTRTPRSAAIGQATESLPSNRGADCVGASGVFFWGGGGGGRRDKNKQLCAAQPILKRLNQYYQVRCTQFIPENYESHQTFLVFTILQFGQNHGSNASNSLMCFGGQVPVPCCCESCAITNKDWLCFGAVTNCI